MLSRNDQPHLNNFNFSDTPILFRSISEFNIAPPNPTEFLLLDNSNFLLLDNTFFLLLGM